MAATPVPAYTAVCTACLSSERRLKPIGDFEALFKSVVLDDVKFSELIHIADLQIELPIAVEALCWECSASLRRMTEFKARAHRARNILISHLNLLSPVEKLQCISTLCRTKVETHDSLTPIPDSQLKVEVKFEVVDFDVSTSVSKEDHLLEDTKDEFEPLDDVPLARTYREKKKKKGRLNKAKKLRSKDAEHKVLKRQVRHYDTVPVSEEQLHLWRRDDANNERYLRLPHKCTSCLVAFNFSDQLVQHNAKKHDQAIGDHACDVCLCRFATEDEMQSHRNLHLALYDCLHCEYITRHKKEMDKHYVMTHSQVLYSCRSCDAVFKTASHLRYHKDDKHGTRWECKHCGKTFRLRNNMYSHMLIHKKLPEAPCLTCGKVMRNKYSLKIHMKTHEQTARTWYCRPCDAHFKSESSYRNHVTTSMKHLTPDKLKYGCEACGRRFPTEKRRRRHYNSVHLKKSEFECDKCSKTYSTKTALKNHIAQKHEDNYQGPPRDKICDICGRGFAVIGVLKSHMRTHTGERPYRCDICPSAFSHHAALYTHKRLVHLKMKRKKASKKKTDDETPEADCSDTRHKAQWQHTTFPY